MSDIPLKDILDFVRPYANEHGWCNNAEDWLTEILHVSFVTEMAPCPCDCCDVEFEAFLDGEQRFTPTSGSPETVSREDLTTLLNQVEWEYKATSLSPNEDVLTAAKEARAKWSL